MKTTARTILLAVIVVGASCYSSLGLDVEPPPAKTPGTPAVRPEPPAPPPPAPLPGKPNERLSYRLRSVTPIIKRGVEYDGVLMRLRQRLKEHDRARNAEEAKWMEGVDNLSIDSITHRPVGVNFFVIKF